MVSASLAKCQVTDPGDIDDSKVRASGMDVSILRRRECQFASRIEFRLLQRIIPAYPTGLVNCIERGASADMAGVLSFDRRVLSVHASWFQ